MNYRPNEMLMWDAWYLNVNGTVHAFHLQRLAPGSTKTVHKEHSVGHAVSTDLVNWKELPAAIAPGAPGELDDMEIFTGCACEHGGVYHLFYTMKCSRENGAVQRLAKATSRDLMTWQKDPSNPVLRPDPRFYCSEEAPGARGIVDCRDLSVVHNPEGEGYYGFYAARVPAEEMPEGAVIACCYSRDLEHWEQRPPVFAPKKYTIIEVPEVFQLDGKWYMLLLINNEYGNRDLIPGQPELTMATIYAVADRPEGPYYEPEDNILLSSRSFNGFACRTVLFEGKRMLMYTSPSRTGGMDSGDPMMGVLSTPKELVIQDGKLRAQYSSLIEISLGGSILDTQQTVPCRLMYQTDGRWSEDEQGIRGSIGTAWARRTFAATARSFIYSAKITVERGVGAGLAFKQGIGGYSGGICMLDYEKQELQLLRIPNLAVVDSRKLPLQYGQAYKVKVVSKDKYLEFYIDDILYLQCVYYAARDGHLGLAVDRGEALFQDVECRLLYCPEEN